MHFARTRSIIARCGVKSRASRREDISRDLRPRDERNRLLDDSKRDRSKIDIGIFEKPFIQFLTKKIPPSRATWRLPVKRKTDKTRSIRKVWFTSSRRARSLAGNCNNRKDFRYLRVNMSSQRAQYVYDTIRCRDKRFATTKRREKEGGGGRGGGEKKKSDEIKVT